MRPVSARVLVVSPGPVGQRMAGPAIRAVELARALEPHADVTLAAVESEQDGRPAFLTTHTKVRSDIRFWPVGYVHDFVDLKEPKACE